MPKKTPQLGGANIKNLDAMVAAGIMTQEEADKVRERHKAKNKKSKSLVKR